jgi:hypothetical protein
MNWPIGASFPPGTSGYPVPNPGYAVPTPAAGFPAPAPVPQYAVPSGPPLPQIPAPQPAAPAQNFGRVALGGEEILDGAGVPPELRGRKVADVMRVYQTLADNFIANRRQQQPPVPQQQPPVPPASPASNAESDAEFWKAPTENIRNLVRQVTQEVVQPIQQQNLAQGARGAVEQARQRIQDFGMLEADIIDIARNAPPEALANPEYWEHAADLARGRRIRSGQYQPPQAPQQTAEHRSIFGPLVTPATQPYPQPVNPNPAPAAPALAYGGYNRPPTAQFFTEAPTAPTPYANTHGVVLSPAQLEVARLSGISPEQYAAMASLNNKPF